MTLSFTTGDNCVFANGARLTEEQVEQLLSIWGDEHDALLKIGSVPARLMARNIRSLWLDLELAKPTNWTPDTIVELAPLNITVRALDERIWAAVPNYGPEAA